ncbi:MAG: hypothetical protein J1F42_01705 [Lachnospiraceae bacterium]|nr:hypothetical protein [Lachnospiraceae bacterium]
MSVKIDLTGRRYGSLVVIELAVDVPGKKKKWFCKCDCGKKIIVSGSNLQSGHTKHCKDCGLKLSNESKVKHGKTRTKIYYVWQGMINRCDRPSHKSYCDYGAKGIFVCDEWHNSKTFIDWALSNGYKEGLEIDRIDTNGSYCPENCRWVDRFENANNKTNNKIISHLGVERTLAEWARFYGVNYKNLSRNLSKGYSLEEAVEREKSGCRSHRKAGNQ